MSSARSTAVPWGVACRGLSSVRHSSPANPLSWLSRTTDAFSACVAMLATADCPAQAGNNDALRARAALSPAAATLRGQPCGMCLWLSVALRRGCRACASTSAIAAAAISHSDAEKPFERAPRPGLSGVVPQRARWPMPLASRTGAGDRHRRASKLVAHGAWMQRRRQPVTGGGMRELLLRLRTHGCLIVGL